MTQVGVHEAKTHLSQLLKRVAAGEEIVIARGAKAVARLVPVTGSGRRELGRDHGLFQIPADFDRALPEEVLRVAALPLHHRDPFDRLLVAQAQLERVPPLTADKQFALYAVDLLHAQ